jgi:uroporphyrinogen-III synthase
MTVPLMVLRPEPGCRETISKARGVGLIAIAAPLFQIEAATWQIPDVARFDAIAAGSANAFRFGGSALRSLASLPVHAVGERTAEAARAAGFAIASVGETHLQDVVDRLRGPMRLLRLAGEKRVSLDPPAGVTIEELVIYRAERQPLSTGVAAALQGGAVALLHSGEAASHFAAECDRLAIDRGRVAIAALAPRIAAAAGGGWRTVATAAEPNDAALLVIAAQLCQTAA